MKLVVESEKASFEQKICAVRSLSLTNLSTAVKILIGFAKISARANKAVYPLLIQMGNIAVPELKKLLNSGVVGAVNMLYQIGTPLATQSLISIIWDETSELSYHSAWRLAALLSRSEIEASLQFMALTPEQRKANQLGWIWKPFEKTSNSAVAIIAGRVAYLLHNAPDVTLPSTHLSELDSRLTIPLCMIAVQNNQIKKISKERLNLIQFRLRGVNLFDHGFLENSSTSEHYKQIFVETYVDDVSENPVWRFIFGKLKLPVQFDILRGLLGDIKPYVDDWLHIFHPLSYDIKKSWHGNILQSLLLFIILANMTLLSNTILLGTIKWNWDAVIQIFTPVIALIAVIFFFRKYIDIGWSVTLMAIFNVSIVIVIGNLTHNYGYSILIAVVGNPIIWATRPYSISIRNDGVFLSIFSIIFISVIYAFITLIISLLSAWIGMSIVIVGILMISFTLVLINTDDWNWSWKFVVAALLFILVMASSLGFLSINLFYDYSTYMLNNWGLFGLLSFWSIWSLIYGLVIVRAHFLTRRSQNPISIIAKYLPNAPQPLMRSRSWLFDALAFLGFRR